LTWAVQKLALHSGDQVLEIGCGTGVAASVLCERLREGRLTAIDRSAAMVGAARRRNRACIAGGRAVIRQLALADVDFDPGSFDRALAVNVNVFWLGPAAELEVLKRILRPSGLLCLVYQPPNDSQIAKVTTACSGFLRAHGFVDVRADVEDLRPAPAVCISAEVPAA
jgi:SAM-dependent methyltransferase